MYKVRHFRKNSNWYNSSYNGSHKGAVTIVSNLIYEPEQQFPTAIEFAVSYCSPKDQFFKKRGIEIATRRLQDKHSDYYRKVQLTARRKLYCYELDRLISATIATSMSRPEWSSSILN